MPITFAEDDPLIRFWTEPERVYQLDVRELLSSGGEPYPSIMHCVGQVQPGDTLLIHALFEPQPLIRQVERVGCKSESSHVGPDHWIVKITRAGM